MSRVSRSSPPYVYSRDFLKLSPKNFLITFGTYVDGAEVLYHRDRLQSDVVSVESLELTLFSNNLW